MKIEFEDKSYLEITKSDNPGKIVVVISAKDYDNPLKRIVNAVEVTVEQFKKLVTEVS